MLNILTAATTTNTGTAHAWCGGKGLLVGAGTFKGGTLLLQVTPDGGTTWVSGGASLTAAGSTSFDLPVADVRASITGTTEATTAAPVKAWIQRIPQAL